jgi:hypothetical protein
LPQSGESILKYFREYVYENASAYQPGPVQGFWIEPTAENRTVHEHREKVAAYLKSSEFQERWSKLKEQVGA